jgi:hypothetical protein
VFGVRSVLLAVFVGLWAVACAVPPVPSSDIVAGLRLRSVVGILAEDHLVELLVHEGHVYAANSNAAVGVVRLDDDGGVTVTDPGIPGGAEIRCTSLAVHAASDTLYCGADAPNQADPVVWIADISTPGTVRWRASFALDAEWVRDLEVVGDRLLIHQFHAGLWTAEIADDGGLSQLRDTGVVGNARVSVELGGRIVTLFGDPAGSGSHLRLLDPETWVELDRLALAGPPLGSSRDAGGRARIAVALGSGGMALVDVDLERDRLRVAETLSPPAVVTQALVDGEVAVAVTLSGAFGWDLGAESPRMFGFGPAGQLPRTRAGNMLHGLLHDGELLTSDWLAVERWALDPSGEVVELDVPRGIYLAPKGPVRWRMRNPGGQDLRAELWVRDRMLVEAEVEAGATVEIALSGSLRREALRVDDPTNTLILRSYDPAVPSAGKPLAATRLVLVQRDPQATLPPATGDPFPTLAFVDRQLDEVYSFPLAEGSQTIWVLPDCAMIWPQIEDLAWLERSGIDLGRGTPVVIIPFDVEGDQFPQRWGLEGLRFGIWGPPAPAAVNQANANYGDDLYQSFFIQAMPGDAMPTDYVIDGEGRVVSIERMYRGPWTLVSPWPWPGN